MDRWFGDFPILRVVGAEIRQQNLGIMAEFFLKTFLNMNLRVAFSAVGNGSARCQARYFH